MDYTTDVVTRESSFCYELLFSLFRLLVFALDRLPTLPAPGICCPVIPPSSTHPSNGMAGLGDASALRPSSTIVRSCSDIESSRSSISPGSTTCSCVSSSTGIVFSNAGFSAGGLTRNGHGDCSCDSKSSTVMLTNDFMDILALCRDNRLFRMYFGGVVLLTDRL